MIDIFLPEIYLNLSALIWIHFLLFLILFIAIVTAVRGIVSLLSELMLYILLRLDHIFLFFIFLFYLIFFSFSRHGKKFEIKNFRCKKKTTTQCFNIIYLKSKLIEINPKKMYAE